MKNVLNKILAFIQKETVLLIAGLLAIGSSFFVKPNRDYIGYIDYSVLILLFCFMLVVAGLKSLGVFRFLGEKLSARVKSVKGLQLTMVLLCFFFSMLITNDVALITFVPFTISLMDLTLEQSKSRNQVIIRTVILETLAANLGSAMTPIGNPQNLLLYSLSGMSIVEFVKILLPMTAISLVLLIVVIMFSKPKASLQKMKEQSECSNSFIKTGYFWIYMILFIACLLKVFRVYPGKYVHWLMLLVVSIIIFFVNKKLFKEADYSLLFTFVFFFIFIGNMKQIPSFHDFVLKSVDGHERVLGIVLSQVISNVPAAMLLSGFTNRFDELLLGVNIGGLGTLIASMASLISYRFFCQFDKEYKNEYLLKFTIWNVIFLVIIYVSTIFVVI